MLLVVTLSVGVSIFLRYVGIWLNGYFVTLRAICLCLRGMVSHLRNENCFRPIIFFWLRFSSVRLSYAVGILFCIFYVVDGNCSCMFLIVSTREAF